MSGSLGCIVPVRTFRLQRFALLTETITVWSLMKRTVVSSSCLILFLRPQMIWSPVYSNLDIFRGQERSTAGHSKLAKSRILAVL